MSTVVDLLLLAAVIFFIVSGMRGGFVRTLLSFISKIAAVVLAYFVSDEYDELVYEKFLKESVINGIEESISASSAGDFSQQVIDVFKSIPESVSGILESLGIDFSSFGEIASSSSVSGEIASLLEETIVRPACVLVCGIVLFAVVSAIASFTFGIIINLVCKFVSLPVLRTANKALGGVLGLLNGLIFVLIVSYICVIASGLTGSEDFSEVISSSHIIEIFTSTINGFIGV